jgi:hypothetical protein
VSKETLTVEIASLKPHPNNARTHDIPAIMRSLERFGQVGSSIIVQRSTGYIVKGHGTTEAAGRLGWKTVDIQLVDMDDDTARGYLLADNATSDKSGYDKGKLLGLLGEALTLEGTGFDENDVEALTEEVSGKTETKRKYKTAASEAEDIDVESESKDADDAGPEPMKEIPLRMPASQIQTFSQQVLDLQRTWGARTLIDVVGKAVAEAHERWQAQLGASNGKPGSQAGLPELSTEF